MILIFAIYSICCSDITIVCLLISRGIKVKKVLSIITAPQSHWVGDGFPVRSLFSYQTETDAISPFLLFDYAGPYNFAPNNGKKRGVGQHPHRGFETVTIVYDGEVSHTDSLGNSGTIGPGDVQWMTAARGILHKEFHSKDFSMKGGPLRMVQLWVNLPAKDKMNQPRYQAITSDNIPTVTFDGGQARVIAGALSGVTGPALTFTPINLWDVKLEQGTLITLALPDGHNSMIAVLSGEITINKQRVAEAEIARLSANGEGATIHASSDTSLLVMTGEPINEPIYGYGPFVMNNEAEIRIAINDFNQAKFGAIAS